MSEFGFIITRHVNSEETNLYWNQCVKLIRTIYPFRKIVIIDDNSNQNLIKADHEYLNLTIIQSEYPGRGELLPYIYYLQYKWFSNAVIIHDSVFIHKKIPFDFFTAPVMPLWHNNSYLKLNVNNILRIASALTNNYEILNKINPSVNILGLNNDKFNLCFGVQSYINLKFLELLQQKYKITNLINVIHNRSDRESLERVMGLLFCQEFPSIMKIESLFGDIFIKKHSFKYNYTQYTKDFKNNRIIYPFVKVWTGR